MIFRRKAFFVSATVAAVYLIAILAFTSDYWALSSVYAGEEKISRESIDLLSRTNHAMAEIVAAVRPSVVNISSSRTVKGEGMLSPFSGNPLLKRFFGDEPRFFERPREYKQSGLASGVIVSRDGYILTNNHVVKGADQIKVTLSDKREFKGKVVGTDPKTDLAVVKIEADNLPVLTLGDSDELKAGETVLAIGNPYGLNQTVTSGIVSATGRANVGIADYEDFIQTDAPINPGNSGGALVNIRGELVGINTAIFSTTGGYQGIGFAIPSNMAKTVMQSLIKEGKVIRGWLGVTIQSLTPDLAKQFNLKDEKGVLVADVVDGGPAEKAGMQRGDIITGFDGKDISDARSLRNIVAGTVPNAKVKINIVRDGRPKILEAQISEMPSEAQTTAGISGAPLNGVQVQDISSALRSDLGIPGRVTGVVVTDIEEGSPAEGVLMKDDVVMEINRTRIRSTKDYEAALSGVRPGSNILLLIFRKGAAFYVTLPAQ